MKYSRQRELVKNAVQVSKMHPTADDIYAILKPENPNLSLGTVYRNLNTLSDLGVIIKLHMPHGCDRFDGKTDEHYHVICDQCDKIFDIKLSLMDEFDECIKQQTGVTATSHQLIVKGTCEVCMQNKKQEEF